MLPRVNYWGFDMRARRSGSSQAPRLSVRFRIESNLEAESAPIVRCLWGQIWGQIWKAHVAPHAEKLALPPQVGLFLCIRHPLPFRSREHNREWPVSVLRRAHRRLMPPARRRPTQPPICAMGAPYSLSGGAARRVSECDPETSAGAPPHVQMYTIVTA
jgi:hypothetical protein